MEKAITERVSLVAIAGDLVDKANRFYEAVGPVETGIRTLASRGIRTVAVAGNHDHDTLPWIADRFVPEEFTLLGRGGEWERLTICVEGSPALHVDGWSFPSATHRDDVLRSYPESTPDGVPILGLLHADLDQATSSYAPVALSNLLSLPPRFWLLGHVHRWMLREEPGAATVLYPGSPQAMDPGESAAHGAWIVEIDAAQQFTARHLPLSAVRYETLTIDVGGIAEEHLFDRCVQDAVLEELRVQTEEGGGSLRHLSLRVRLVGATHLHRWLGNRGDGFAADLSFQHDGATVHVERVEIATRPLRDLAALAQGQDAPGILAHLILGLDRNELDEGERGLLQQTVTRTLEVNETNLYRQVNDDSAPGLEAATSILRDHALLLLEELLAQKERP